MSYSWEGRERKRETKVWRKRKEESVDGRRRLRKGSLVSGGVSEGRKGREEKRRRRREEGHRGER